MYQKPNFYYIPFFIKFAIPGKILLGFLSSFMLESSSAVVEIMVSSQYFVKLVLLFSL